MVSTHCHFSQKAAYDRARASSYCIHSFFNVARYAIPVARYAIPVVCDAIRVSLEGGNLPLSGTVSKNKKRIQSRITKENKTNVLIKGRQRKNQEGKKC